MFKSPYEENNFSMESTNGHLNFCQIILSKDSTIQYMTSLATSVSKLLDFSLPG